MTDEQVQTIYESCLLEGHTEIADLLAELLAFRSGLVARNQELLDEIAHLRQERDLLIVTNVRSVRKRALENLTGMKNLSVTAMDDDGA